MVSTIYLAIYGIHYISIYGIPIYLSIYGIHYLSIYCTPYLSNYNIHYLSIYVTHFLTIKPWYPLPFYLFIYGNHDLSNSKYLSIYLFMVPTAAPLPEM